MSKEKKETGYSYTSNTVKLLKHMDKLQELQKGRSSPIMVHMAVTNKCNLNCIKKWICILWISKNLFKNRY